jgi:hypothetical protein
MAIIKKVKVINAGKDMEKWNLFTIGGNVN